MAVHDLAYKRAAAKLKKNTAIDPANLAGAKLANSPAFLALAGRTQGSGLAGGQLANSPAFQAALAAKYPQSAATPVASPAAAANPNGDISTADPRDSTFGAGLAALLGQVQAQRNAVASQGASDQQSYDENLGRIAANRAKSLDDTKTTSNRQGLLYSGILGQRNGQVNGAYDDQVNSESNALTGRKAARESQLQQIGNLTADPNSPYGYTATGGAGMDFYNLLRAAADRRVGAMSNDSVDTPDPPATTAATAQPATPPPAGSGQPTAALPVYHPGTPTPAPRPPRAIHGSSTVTLKPAPFLSGYGKGASLGKKKK